MNPPNINTDHCMVKLLDVSHAQLMRAYYQKNKDNLETWEPKRSPEFYSLSYWQSRIRDSTEFFKKQQAVKLIALDKNQKHVIGTCNFNNIVLGCFYACHLGYSIDKDYEGKGIMYEIILAGINFMHEEFKLHRIMANHLPNNHRSEKLLHRLGFEKEGYAKSYLKINGKWQDHVLNSLILPSK